MSNEVQAEEWAPQGRGAWPTSWLYVPANKPALLEKAAHSHADALIVDLEDAVPQPEKGRARRTLTEWMSARAVSRTELIAAAQTNSGQAENAAEHRAGSVNGKPVWVRINAGHVAEDIAALTGPDGIVLCTGVVLAKAEPEALAELEGVTKNRIPIIGLVESAVGLRKLEEMATSESVVTFGIGEVDLLADLRMRRSYAAEAAIDAIRLQVVIICAAAGLRAPLAPTSTDFRDLSAFAASTRKFQDLGFRARTAIHPAQCAVVNTAFTPTGEEIDEARKIVDRSAKASGGVTLDDSGRLIDAAVVRGAIETLERVRAASPLPHSASSIDLATRRN